MSDEKTQIEPISEYETEVGTGLILHCPRTEAQKEKAAADLQKRADAYQAKEPALFGEPFADEDLTHKFRHMITRHMAESLNNADRNVHDIVHMTSYVAALIAVAGCGIMSMHKTFGYVNDPEKGILLTAENMKRLLDFAIEMEGKKFDEFINETGFTSEKGIRKH